MHDVPALLVQLQDDLSRSQKREAFWMSVVVHLVFIILIVNSPKFEKYFPHRNLVVGPNDWLQQKDLTYLELPPDAQKLTKRPKTNIISDKDRMATSRTPQLDTKELRKILDSSPPPPLPARHGAECPSHAATSRSGSEDRDRFGPDSKNAEPGRSGQAHLQHWKRLCGIRH